MFANSKVYEQKKKQRIEKVEKLIKVQANNKKISSKSEKITNEIKNAVFKRVFELLDIEGEDKIYGKRIELELLPDTLKKIFEPLIHELREQNESLTSDEFLMACDHLYSV